MHQPNHRLAPYTPSPARAVARPSCMPPPSSGSPRTPFEPGRPSRARRIRQRARRPAAGRRMDGACSRNSWSSVRGHPPRPRCAPRRRAQARKPREQPALAVHQPQGRRMERAGTRARCAGGIRVRDAAYRTAFTKPRTLRRRCGLPQGHRLT